MELSPPNYLDWKRTATCFDSAGAHVTPELLPMLGVEPVFGRLISEDDVKQGAPQVLLLSYGLWQAECGGASDVLGRSVRLGDVSASVIGVLPKGFSFPRVGTRYWMPLGWNAVQGEQNRDNNWLNVVARLRQGVSLDKARAEMNVVAEQLERAYPKENEKTRANVLPLRDQVSAQSRLLLLALVGGAVGVLLALGAGPRAEA